ncbi:MAG: hypothetical protein QOE26_1793 [Verrucomicrobiota bacterium]
MQCKLLRLVSCQSPGDNRAAARKKLFVGVFKPIWALVDTKYIADLIETQVLD